MFRSRINRKRKRLFLSWSDGIKKSKIQPDCIIEIVQILLQSTVAKELEKPSWLTKPLVLRSPFVTPAFLLQINRRKGCLALSWSFFPFPEGTRDEKPGKAFVLDAFFNWNAFWCKRITENASSYFWMIYHGGISKSECQPNVSFLTLNKRVEDSMERNDTQSARY